MGFGYTMYELIPQRRADMSRDELRKELLALEPEERLLLADWLYETVEPEEELDEEWEAEVSRRVDGVQNGSVSPVSSGDIFRKALETLK